MSYSLNDFCDDARAILLESDDHHGRERIRQKLELLLCDAAFCTANVGPDNDVGVRQIFEDPDLHFCVLAYNMAEARTSPPHDHGSSWAVYGQAVGYTDMTIWSAADSSDSNDGHVEAIRTFRLEPGQAGLFDVREIHSIQYPDHSKFVRVTGVDMSQETRRVFDLETGTVRAVEHVGTGKL
jgi:predicted metal-dependent enzyme (double-stranded beta helix superfamily)